MDSESMSRSSTKFASGVTSSAGVPAISSMISASPERISWSVTVSPYGGLCVITAPLTRGRSSWTARLGYRDHLRRVGQARAERDEQRGGARLQPALLGHPRQGERYRRRRRVARGDDVVGDPVARYAEPPGDRLDDPQ